MSINVFYQRKRFEAAETPLLGSVLRGLFGVPAGDLLYREHGNRTEGSAIGDGDSVPIKNGDRFISIPNDIAGGATASAVALSERARREIDRAREELFPVELRLAGERPVVIASVPSEGWTPDPVRVLVRIPTLYPDEKPDLIFLEAKAAWPQGATPRLMQRTDLAGETWQQISWHWSGTYDPKADALYRFIASIRKYLRNPAS